LEYDLTFDESSLKAFNEELAAGKKPTEAVVKAENGKYYLAPGNYTVYVSLNGEKLETTLSIKPPQARPARKPMKKTP